MLSDSTRSDGRLACFYLFATCAYYIHTNPPLSSPRTQIANVAALPGIVGRSIGLPDVHSGYGFAIGNVAAFDMADPEAVVSPGMVR